MHDRDAMMWHRQEIDVYYKKRKDRPQGNINAEVRTFHWSSKELVILMAMMVADIMDQFTSMMVWASGDMTRSQCYLLIWEAVDKLINEKYWNSVKMSKDEKAEFMEKFVDTRNKMQNKNT